MHVAKKEQMILRTFEWKALAICFTPTHALSRSPEEPFCVYMVLFVCPKLNIFILLTIGKNVTIHK